MSRRRPSLFKTQLTNRCLRNGCSTAPVCPACKRECTPLDFGPSGHCKVCESNGLGIPEGICQCGCGSPTRLASVTRRAMGWVRGRPIRFVAGHSKKGPRSTVAEIFNRNITKTDGCWLWQGGLSSSGYGVIHIGRVGCFAHRVSWEIANARPIPEGMFVCHSCDTPRCVNPAHLWIGTAGDNNRDAAQKGRLRHPGFVGEENPQATISPDIVAAMRAMRRDGAAFSQIAGRFEVSISLAHDAVRGHCWAHLPGAVTKVEDQVRNAYLKSHSERLSCNSCGTDSALDPKSFPESGMCQWCEREAGRSQDERPYASEVRHG
jgi:hypothetical protein